MGCQEKFGTGKIHEVILLLSSGQLFSESYQGKIVTGSVGSSLNFTWTMSRSFQEITVGLAATPTSFGSAPQFPLMFTYGKQVPVSVPEASTGKVVFTMCS